MSSPLYSLPALKAQAKALRAGLEADGHTVSHSKSLELLAHQLGHRDWNTLFASLGNQPPIPFALGMRVQGHYLGQAFDGVLMGVQSLASGKRFRVSVQLDEAVDVISFESMSNFRSRVRAVVDADGLTVEKTSDGVPHLQMRPA